MARPRKQGLEYFPHNTDAARDSGALEQFVTEYGARGYAFYFILLENIYVSPDYKLELYTDERRKRKIYFLAKKCMTTPKKFEEMLAAAVEKPFELFDKSEYLNGYITSSGIRRRATEIDALRDGWRSNSKKHRLSAEKTPEITGEQCEENRGENSAKKSKANQKQRESKSLSPSSPQSDAPLETVAVATTMSEMRQEDGRRFAVANTTEGKIAETKNAEPSNSDDLLAKALPYPASVAECCAAVAHDMPLASPLVVQIYAEWLYGRYAPRWIAPSGPIRNWRRFAAKVFPDWKAEHEKEIFDAHVAQDRTDHTRSIAHRTRGQPAAISNVMKNIPALRTREQIAESFIALGEPKDEALARADKVLAMREAG